MFKDKHTGYRPSCESSKVGFLFSRWHHGLLYCSCLLEVWSFVTGMLLTWWTWSYAINLIAAYGKIRSSVAECPWKSPRQPCSLYIAFPARYAPSHVPSAWSVQYGTYTDLLCLTSIFLKVRIWGLEKNFDSIERCNNGLCLQVSCKSPIHQRTVCCIARTTQPAIPPARPERII